MENREDILDALTAFGKNPNQQEIPLILERYLNCVAKNGETLFPWAQLKPLIVGKMEKVIQELKQGLDSENIPSRPNVENVRFDVIHARIIDALHRFNGAPFTIQRLCELLTDPKRHYKRSDKFMRGLEKNVLVVSTVDPFGRKVVCESSSKHMVNGMDVNGTFPPRDTALTVPLPPVPGWVTTSNAPTSRTLTPPSAPMSDQRRSAQSSTQTPGVVSNGVISNCLASTVYSDQEEQLAVHTEEVVEETVVTMETNDVSSVTTDAGEALAEGEEDEDMADDRTSSSSSSSSSSSEELSTSSDSVDCSLQGSVPMAATSSSLEPGLNDHRPWAAITHDEEGKKQSDTITSPSVCQTEIHESSHNTTQDNPCSPPTSTTMSSNSHDNTGPALFTPESTSESPGVVDQAEVDSALTPESSVVDSPQQSTQVTRLTADFSTSDNSSLPTDSISTSDPDSLQSTDKSSIDTSISASVTGHHPIIATSLNPDSQALSSSSDTDSESDATSKQHHVIEAELLGVSAEPAVSSSSSSCTSPSTVPMPVCDNVDTQSLEVMPDSALSVASSESDSDLEPPRKLLKLSDDDVGTETDSSSTRRDLSAMSDPHPRVEPMDHVHSSAEGMASSVCENIATSNSDSVIDARESSCSNRTSDDSCENQLSENPSTSLEDPFKVSVMCSDELKEDEVMEKGAVSSADPSSTAPNDGNSGDQMNIG